MCTADVLAAMRAVGGGEPPKKRIAAFVRLFQGKKRAAYKPDLTPDWWPEGMRFAAPSNLTKVECGLIVEAAVAHATGDVSREEDDAEREEGEKEFDEADVLVEKEDDELACTTRGMRARGRGKVEDTQVEFVEAEKVEDVEKEGGSGGIGNSSSSGNDNGKAELDEMHMPPHVVTQVSGPVADDATIAARRDSGESAADEDGEFSPDDIPLEALLEAAAFPSDDELDAMVEEGQRALDDYVVRLNEERTLQKINMARLLRQCQRKLDMAAQRLVLGLDEETQRMPAREYVVGSGGNPEQVLEAGIIRGHPVLEEIFAPVVEGEREAIAARDV